jgi:hypothetical protein
MSNKANQSTFISTALKMRRWKTKRNKENPNVIFFLETFILIALLTQEAQAQEKERLATAGVNIFTAN